MKIKQVITMGLEDDTDNEEFMNAMSILNFVDDDCVITGTLGLWHGKVKVSPSVGSAHDLFYRAIGQSDSCEVRISSRGRVLINAYHHDGVNEYEIHRLGGTGTLCKSNYRALLSEYLS